jgi:hypothetical protein
MEVDADGPFQQMERDAAKQLQDIDYYFEKVREYPGAGCGWAA